MPDVEIRPFSDKHLEAAATLLAERHERHLAAEPLLAKDVDFRAQVDAQDGAGVVAQRDGEVRAYLIGRTTEEDAVVDLAGCAAAEPELLRDLYAVLAADWGRDRHRVYVPATDAALVDVWFRLAFGLQFTYAVREASPVPAVDADVEIRPGTADDLEAVVLLEQAFTEHLRASPSFSGREPRTDEEGRELWRGTWDDPAFTHFVAARDRRVVGHVLMYRREPGDLRIPANSIDLSLAVTMPDARGSGVGSALAAHALQWAHDEGYAAITVDWRVVNLLASRFFAARGFRPTFYRLYRHIP
jgi:ribosomal protein S18 acetylase RimI-like enzyme